MNWYLEVFKKYAEFNGRARRKEYWMFTLFSTLATYLFQGIDYLAGLTFEGAGFLSTIYTLIAFIPGLAVTTRRFHDVNKSGWNWLWVLLPIFGWIYLFILSVTNGDEGKNQYGLDPKNPTTELDEIGIVQD